MDYKSHNANICNKFIFNRLNLCEREVDQSSPSQFSEDTIRKLEYNLLRIKSSYDITENYDVLMISLSYVQGFLVRNDIHEIDGLKKNGIVRILIEVSQNFNGSYRKYSLSCLGRLVWLMPDTFQEMVNYNFEKTVLIILQSGSFQYQEYVFLWIGNILMRFSDYPLLSKIDIEILCNTSINFISSEYCKNNINNNSEINPIDPIYYMFYSISSINSLDKRAVTCLFHTFKFFLMNENKHGIYYIICSIHSILSNKNYPTSDILEILLNNDIPIEIHNIMNSYKSKVDKKNAFSLYVMCDLFENKYFKYVDDIKLFFILMLKNNQYTWFKIVIIETFCNILKYCPNEIEKNVESYPIFEFLEYGIQNECLNLKTMYGRCILLFIDICNVNTLEQFYNKAIIYNLFDLLNNENTEYDKDFIEKFPRLIKHSYENNRFDELLSFIDIDEFTEFVQTSQTFHDNFLLIYNLMNQNH